MGRWAWGSKKEREKILGMERECFSRSGNRNVQTLIVEKGRNTFPTLVPAEELVWHTNGCLKTEGEMRRPWGGRGLPS